jgi:phosphate starvation-inducible membrane PsiE
MYFLIGLFIFMTLVIGLNFIFLLIGGTPFHKGAEGEAIRSGKRTYTVEKFAVGVSTGAFGLCWLAAWFYFLITGWDSFILQFESLIFHVVLQFFVSLGLITASIGIFRQWKKSKNVFLVSMVTLIVSLVIAILVYGSRGHGDPIFMYLLGLWTLVIGGFFTTGVFALDRLVNSNPKN